MATFRSTEEIILAMLDHLRITEPDLDTKPGTVARDLIEAPGTEIAKLYVELRNIANRQSIAAASGRDLDLLARNFGLSRGQGSPSTGTVVFTTNELDTDILIPAGTLITARNGISFSTITEITLDSSKQNVFRSNAIRLRSDLDLAGISDDYAVEVGVEATSFGSNGNIGKFGIITQSIPGISNVTNIQNFTGGANSEGDDAFRARVLGIFAGSNTGTSLGYTNAILRDPAVVDVLAVEPGDPLMTRDGTDVSVNNEGESVIIEAGTGGKVDLYILGSRLNEFTESYIFRDLSGKNDATDPANDFTLGQRGGINPLLNFQQRKQLLIEQGTLPFQPVSSLLSVSGSLSGPNFTEKFIDDEGQVQGSFELVKDTGNFTGSPFGFDTLHFISNQVGLENESIAKGVFNGEDALDYSDVRTVTQARLPIVINNEQPTVSSSDRSILTLKHTPITVVNSILNVTTGQRYRISNQNVDGTNGGVNTTGRIQISGGTLPTSTDVLQANYIWDHRFDNLIDYDNLLETSITRTTQDSVDWGFSNRVLAEETSVLLSGADGYHILVEHPISRVTNVNTIVVEDIVNVSGKLTVANTITNIRNIIRVADGKEIFNTLNNNGSFSGKEITLPTDAQIANGETATVYYNVEDIYSPDGYDTGSFTGNKILLQDDVASVGETVFIDYVANVNNLLPVTSLVNLPVTGSLNEFLVASNAVGNQPISNIYDANDNITRNLRFAPSYLRFNMQGILANGRLTIKGTSLRKVEEIITVRRNGLKIDLSDAVKIALDLNTLTSTGFVAYVDKIEQVTLSNDLVSSVDYTYDLLNYELKNIQYANQTAFEDSSLTDAEISLSGTEYNTAQTPSTGLTLRVVFYWADTNAVERMVVSTSGTQFSRNRYIFVDKVAVDSGFVGLSGSIEGTVTIDNFNQPGAGDPYFLNYNYTAPKEGERITVTYNYNRLISDSTFNLEDVRPITADVLVKAATALPIDMNLAVVALPEFTGGDENLRQSVAEAVTNFLSSNGLGTIMDVDDVIAAVHRVVGVDRVTITNFNFADEIGVRQSISAGRNEYITAGTIEVEIEER